MYEKVSDELIREEKVKKLKTKILSEIAKELNLTKEEIKWCLLDGDDDFDFLVKRSFVLLNLKEYIEWEGSFCRFTYRDPANDIIIYSVSDRQLNMWLQDDYYFVHHFLTQAEDYGYDVFPLLNDNHFGYRFNSILDNIIYDNKGANR